MVAPSFQTMTIISEVYIKNNKNYIDVKNEKTGTIRSVRWYTDAEYRKAYPSSAAAAPASGFSGLKQARGFSKGPIIVLSGNDEQWLSASIARFATDVGWYIASTDLPPAFPPSIVGAYLSWEEACEPDERHMKSPSVLKSIISEKFKKHRDLVNFE